MENLKPLTDFFDAIEKDLRISSTHIDIYTVVLRYCSLKGFINPIEIFRVGMVPIAKISSKSTYDKCLHELLMQIIEASI